MHVRNITFVVLEDEMISLFYGVDSRTKIFCAAISSLPLRAGK